MYTFVPTYIHHENEVRYFPSFSLMHYLNTSVFKGPGLWIFKRLNEMTKVDLRPVLKRFSVLVTVAMET